MAAEGLDTVVTAETPEGILLELRPAGLPARFYAFLLDWVVRLVVIYLAALVAAIMGGIGTSLFLIVFFLLEWLYPVAFELTSAGATPGKRAFSLRVVMDNGLPVTPAASITRNLLRAADFLPLGYGFALVSMLLRRDNKRLGDIAAATLVIHEPRGARRISLEAVTPVPPARPLSPRDQAAVLALAERARTLTTERLDELAALAAPAAGEGGGASADVTRRVLGVAQWLLGHRA